MMSIGHSSLHRTLKNFWIGDTLKARAARSTSWTIGSMAAMQFLRLASNLVLTRLLFPEAFGLMAILQIFLTGLGLISDTGIRASIVQNDRGTDPVFLDTAWTIQVLRGALLWLITCAAAAPIGWFYDDPRLTEMMPFVGLTLFIKSFMPTRVFTAGRELIIGRLTVIRLGAHTAGIAITIILAWLLQSVWSLVFGSILASLVLVLSVIFLFPGRRNRPRFERDAASSLFHFGKWIFLSSAFGFIINHADRAILGKFITLDMLGIYSVGFFLASVPLLLGRPLANKIVFPLYKQRPPWESIENQKKIFQMRRLLTGALLCISTVLALIGNWLVGFLYDPRYTLAGPILVMLVISQLPAVILSSYDQIMLAAGDSKRFTTRVAATAFAQTALLILGVMHFGILGATLAPGLAAILVYPILVSAVRRYDGWDKTHDLIYGGVALMIAAVGFWLNYDAIVMLASETIPG